MGDGNYWTKNRVDSTLYTIYASLDFVQIKLTEFIYYSHRVDIATTYLVHTDLRHEEVGDDGGVVGADPTIDGRGQ